MAQRFPEYTITAARKLRATLMTLSVDSFPAQPAPDHRPDERPPHESAKPIQGLSRRRALAGLAVLPVVLPAAAAEPDPIFAVIGRHRELGAHYSAAVDISSNMSSDDPGFEAADAVTEERCDALLDHADDELISTLPTTFAGIVALLRYMADLPDWQQPRDFVAWEIDGATADWHQVLLVTVADALDNISGRAA